MYIEIKTDRLVLRPLSTNDLHTTHEYAGDIENTKYALMLPNKSLAETAHYLSWAASEWEKAPQTAFEFAITLEGHHIGAVSVRLDRQTRTAVLGWILHKAHWHRGYATEAALAVKQFAIHTLGAKTLMAHCDHKNIDSIRLMKQIGLQLDPTKEGTRQYPDSRGVSGESIYTMQLEHVDAAGAYL